MFLRLAQTWLLLHLLFDSIIGIITGINATFKGGVF